jgi:hypothetical protein
MRFKKGYFIGAASLAVVALVCSVISVKANPNEGHNNNFSCDANVTFVDNSNVSDAFLNQPATIPNFIPSTEGNIQGNLMTLQEPIIGENTSVQTPSQENNNQQNVQMPEEPTGSNEANNQCNGNINESTGTVNNSNNTGCTGNIVGTSKDVDQSVILYEKDLLDSDNNDSNISSNTGTGCTTLENTSNNMVSSTTISNNI